MLILGIDDAGRGPIIGPMVLAGVLINPSHEETLKGKVTDSKLLSQIKRVELTSLINGNCIKSHVVTSDPIEIDSSVAKGELNVLEAKKAAEIINVLNVLDEQITVIVDCPSVNTISWKNQLISYIENKSNLTIKCEHKADFNYPSVAAASILAKVKREEEVTKLKSIYGDIGSGYASDPATKIFLRENGEKLKDSGIFRKSWSTWTALFPAPGQKKLLDY